MQNLDLSFLKSLIPQLVAALPWSIIIILGAFLIHFVAMRALGLLAANTRLTDNDLLPFRRVVKWTIILATFALILSVLGFNLGGLWTVFSTLLAMIAIGFVAVWSVLSNVLCTFIILVSRPFAIGDEIEFAGDPVRGRVIDLNFIYTTLKAEDGLTVQIPNNLFFQKVLKRRAGQVTISLAAQLSSRQPANF